MFVRWYVCVCFVILVSIVVSIPACHAGDPGLIPGREVLLLALSDRSDSAYILNAAYKTYAPIVGIKSLNRQHNRYEYVSENIGVCDRTRSQVRYPARPNVLVCRSAVASKLLQAVSE